LYGIDHARTLAVVGPNLYRVMFETKRKIGNGKRIFNLTELRMKCKRSINKKPFFFHTMGMDTKSDYTKEYDKQLIL
jgi:NADP-dependent alcohol dehydrogenase